MASQTLIKEGGIGATLSHNTSHLPGGGGMFRRQVANAPVFNINRDGFQEEFHRIFYKQEGESQHKTHASVNKSVNSNYNRPYVSFDLGGK